MLPTAHRLVVETVCDRLAGLDVVWAVTGSVALAVHGLPVSCNDVDLMTTAVGAGKIAGVFDGEVIKPIRRHAREGIRGHLGALSLGGIVIEVLGDVQNALPDGGWTAAPRIEQYRQWVVVGDRHFPVLSLGYLRDAYELMGRADKVKLITAALPSPV